MPVLVQSLYIFLPACDGAHTFPALDWEQIFKTFLTIWLARINQESFTAETTITEGADEMIGMPAFAKSIDTILSKKMEKKMFIICKKIPQTFKQTNQVLFAKLLVNITPKRPRKYSHKHK